MTLAIFFVTLGLLAAVAITTAYFLIRRARRKHDEVIRSYAPYPPLRLVHSVSKVPPRTYDDESEEPRVGVER
jgi:hypothetical protein